LSKLKSPTFPGVLKVAYDYDDKTFVLQLFKILRSSSSKWAVKIENGIEHGIFSVGKFLADYKNVHILYVWRPNLTGKSK
jgi:hypothetical protein